MYRSQPKTSFKSSKLEKTASGGWLRPGWRTLRSSFWFLPTVGGVGGLALAWTTRHLDLNWKSTWGEIPIIFSGGATDAHYILSAITGSLITIIVTSFSLTLVILQLASSQYSPRLLKSFTADSAVQLTIAIYVATFLYSLMCLMFMYTPSRKDVTIFIPVFSVTVAIALMMICVAVLIYFMQHISKLIQSATIVKMAQDDTMKAIVNLEDLGDAPMEARAPEGDPVLEGLLSGEPAVIQSEKTGYLQRLDVDSIVRPVAVGEGTVVIEVPFAPGHSVSAGLPLVKVWATHRIAFDSGVQKKIRSAFKFGTERSFQQDFTFGLRQLSDIALKALSSGINDPTTAMQALDRLEAIFVALGSKALPSRLREREVAGARVVVKVNYPSFEDNVGLAFDQVRRAAFAGGDIAVLERLVEALERAMLANAIPERRRILWDQVFNVARIASSQPPDPGDAANLIRRVVAVGMLLDPEQHPRAHSDLDKLVSISEKLENASKIKEPVADIA